MDDSIVSQRNCATREVEQSKEPEKDWDGDPDEASEGVCAEV